MPPPTSLKGVAKTAVDMLKGSKPTVFIDKLGERAAFERTGTRLYQGALAKFDVLGSWDGGPTRAARVVAAAAAAGVVLDDLSMYQESATQAGFVFGFGAVNPDALDAGLAVFADLLRSA